VETDRSEGNSSGRIKLFTLSTCIWCKKTKALLKEMDIAYDYVDVDMLDSTEKEKALEELKRFNPQCSFPSLVVDSAVCIVGFKETEIREALKS
jgi:glutaredoxin-like protein NrdH